MFKNVLDLVNKEFLRSFLLGYNHIALAGVAIYFKTCSGIPEGPDDIGFFNATPNIEDVCESYHPHCSFYRTRCGHDDKCISFDKCIALDYYTNPEKGPMFYRCHRELWDMTYPLFIENQLIGVLYSGQINVKKRSSRIYWPKEFGEIYSFVSWDYADSNESHHDQREDIITVINNDGDLSGLQKEDLIKALRDNDAKGGKNIPLSELNRHFQDFLNFGKITCKVLSEQYKLKKSANEFKEQNLQISFQKKCSLALSADRPGNIRYWQKTLAKTLAMVAVFFQIKRIGFFYGHIKQERDVVKQKIFLELVAMDSPKWWRTAREFSWNKEEYPERDVVYAPGKLPTLIADVVSENRARDNFFYVFPYANEASNIYTLAILQNNRPIPGNIKNCLKDILMQICVRDESVRLNLREQLIHEAFEQHVVEVRHDLKTDLQIIVDNTQKYVRMLRRGVPTSDQAAMRQYDLVRQAVTGHVEAIRTLTWEIELKKQRKFKPLNLFSAIEQQVSLFESVAQQRNIRIILRKDKDMEDRFIIFDRSQFNRGVQVLLDNAVKYSYDNFEINIKSNNQGNKFIFSIENFGIGIPPDILKDVTERERRAGVQDMGKKHGRGKPITRRGEGLGLYIANDIFTKQLNGSLVIASKKSPNVYKDTEKYHRYITTVTVTIPTQI